MFPNYIFFPAQIDLYSTVIWGVVTAAVGGLVVELARGSIKIGMGVNRIVLILFFGVLVWIGPYNIPTYYYLVRGNAQKNCLDGIEYWYKAHQKQPKFGLAYLQIGKCYLQAGNYTQAIEWLLAGKDFEPHKPIVSALANSYFLARQYDQALTSYQQGVKAFPKDFDLRIGLGVTLHYQEKFQASLAELANALELDANSAAAHFWYGWALYENQRFEEAVKHFQTAIEYNFNTGRAHAGLGFCHLKLQNYGIAKQEFLTALELVPDQVDVQKQLQLLNGQ